VVFLWIQDAFPTYCKEPEAVKAPCRAMGHVPSANPLQNDFQGSLEVSRSDDPKLVFPLFFLIFIISEV